MSPPVENVVAGDRAARTTRLFASSLGTVFEWYDSIHRRWRVFRRALFPGEMKRALLAFRDICGRVIVRPFGALVFVASAMGVASTPSSVRFW